MLGFMRASCKYEATELAEAAAVISVEYISEDGLMAAVKQIILCTDTETTCQPRGCSTEEGCIVKIVNFPSSLFNTFQSHTILMSTDYTTN